MCLSLHHLCLHLVIIICLSVSLSGNTVSPNTTILDSITELHDTSTTETTTESTSESRTESKSESTTLPVSTTSETETTSIKKLTEANDKTTKPLVITDATKPPLETKKSSTSTVTAPQANTTTKSPSSSSQSSTANTTLTSTTSSATTSNSTSSTATTASSTTSSIETMTNAEGISAIRVQGKKKRLSLSDIANTPSTTTTTVTTNKSTLSKPRKKGGRKKKKRRPSRQPRKQKGSSRTTQDGVTKKTPTRATRKDDVTSVTPKPASPGKVPASLLTTAYPVSPDATIHKVEADVKPVLFAAAAADNKKSGGKKAGKKGTKKGGKAQGKKKGDTGAPGPAGPKGAKGEPGTAAQSSMPMQAAASAVLTEHFGPDKDVIVPFDLKLIDLADNYDNTTGVFICTIPGVYVVSLYLMSHPGAKVNARVFINSRPIAALWADDSKNSGFYPSSSIQTISRLAFGDQVYVMLVDGGYGESWVHANYNAFSLFLLYEDVFFN